LRKRQDWPWYRVKAAVEAKNKTLSAVAIENGLSPSAVHRIKRIPIPLVQKILAKLIGFSPQAVWPTRYDHRGNPVRSYLWVKDNTCGANRNLQKQEGPSSGSEHSRNFSHPSKKKKSELADDLRRTDREKLVI